LALSLGSGEKNAVLVLMTCYSNQQSDPPRDSMGLLLAIFLAHHNPLKNSLPFGRMDILLASDLNKTAEIISRRQNNPCV
jgi:hypothetical protein